MNTILKAIVFQIGVDCLGFPQFHKHEVPFQTKSFEERNYKTVFHKNYHQSLKYN